MALGGLQVLKGGPEGAEPPTKSKTHTLSLLVQSLQHAEAFLPNLRCDILGACEDEEGRSFAGKGPRNIFAMNVYTSLSQTIFRFENLIFGGGTVWHGLYLTCPPNPAFSILDLA